MDTCLDCGVPLKKRGAERCVYHYKKRFKQSKRFISPKPRDDGMTEIEVLAAVRAFQAKGGLIKRLPDQDTPRRTIICRQYEQYENVIDHA